MTVKCDECGYLYEVREQEGIEKKGNTKCPRCGKINLEKRGCENCKGCSLWKSCKKT